MLWFILYYIYKKPRTAQGLNFKVKVGNIFILKCRKSSFLWIINASHTRANALYQNIMEKKSKKKVSVIPQQHIEQSQQPAQQPMFQQQQQQPVFQQQMTNAQMQQMGQQQMTNAQVQQMMGQQQMTNAQMQQMMGQQQQQAPQLFPNALFQPQQQQMQMNNFQMPPPQQRMQQQLGVYGRTRG